MGDTSHSLWWSELNGYLTGEEIEAKRVASVEENTFNLVLESNSLTPGLTYIFVASLIHDSTTTVKTSSSISIQVNKGVTSFSFHRVPRMY